LLATKNHKKKSQHHSIMSSKMMKALRKKTGSSTGTGGVGGGWSAENRSKSSSYFDDAESFGELQQPTTPAGTSNGPRGGAVDHMIIPNSKPSAPTELHQLVISHDWDEMRSMLGFVDDAMSNPSSQGENDVPNGASNGGGSNMTAVKGLKKKGLKGRRGGVSSSGDGSFPAVKRQHCLAQDQSGRTP